MKSIHCVKVLHYFKLQFSKFHFLSHSVAHSQFDESELVLFFLPNPEESESMSLTSRVSVKAHLSCLMISFLHNAQHYRSQAYFLPCLCRTNFAKLFSQLLLTNWHHVVFHWMYEVSSSQGHKHAACPLCNNACIRWQQLAQNHWC